MIDEHEITRKAYEQKAEIIETANEMSREISKGTDEPGGRKHFVTIPFSTYFVYAEVFVPLHLQNTSNYV